MKKAKQRVKKQKARRGKKPLTNSQQRVKDYSQIFTPPTLVNEMLDTIEKYGDSDIWGKTEKTWLDPSCGNGVFLIEILDRLIAAGTKPLVALWQIHGIDILPENVMATKLRLLDRVNLLGDIEAVAIVNARIKCADFLKAPVGNKLFWHQPQSLDLVKKFWNRKTLDILDEVHPENLEWLYMLYKMGETKDGIVDAMTLMEEPVIAGICSDPAKDDIHLVMFAENKMLMVVGDFDDKDTEKYISFGAAIEKGHGIKEEVKKKVRKKRRNRRTDR